MKKKNALPPGESAAPETVCFSEPAGPPGRANPEKTQTLLHFAGAQLNPQSVVHFWDLVRARFFGISHYVFAGFVTLQQKKGFNKHAAAYLYIYIYICMPDGRMWDHVLSKTGRFGVHLRAGSGPTRVSHYKNRHFGGTVWRPRKRPTSHKLPSAL